MFKRGGSTTGTGIMSHVEPRVNRAFGSPFPNFGVTQMPPQSQIDAFKQAEINRQNRLNKGFNILGPAFTMPEDYPGTVSDYRNFLREQEKSMMTDKDITGGIVQLQPGQSAFDAVFAPVDEEMAKQKAEKQKLLEDKPDPGKDEPAYKGTDIKSEVEKEAAFLKDLLKNEDYSKGELALIVAGALNEPGSFSDKIKKAGELALPIARKARQEDKAITLAAYKAAKEKEKYQTRYGQDSDTIRFYKERAKSLVGTPGYKDKTEDDIYKELMSGSAEARVNILKSPQTAGEIKQTTDRISRLKLEEKTASEKRKKQIVDEILQQKSQLEFLIKMPEFESIYPGVKESLGFKYGGRVMKAAGGDMTDEETVDMEESDNTVGMAVDKIGEGSGSQTVSEPVQRLSYAELRDRLPQEITDDVVNLLANSEEALQQFAYIRTQDDVNSFNAKYGVNLVIPPTRG
jgi:hypothetical protein